MTTKIPGVWTLLCRSDDVLWERPKSGKRHWIFVSQHSNHRSDNPTYRIASERLFRLEDC